MNTKIMLLPKALCMLLLATMNPSSSQESNTHLRYIGHASFEWVTPTGTHIIIDPYHNSFWLHWFDESFPKLKADFVLVTHPHFDHNAVSKIEGNPQVIDKAEIIQRTDFTIQGITGHHARSRKHGHRNLIFIIEINGVRFCHWGDNDANVTDELRNELGRIDILMLPVDESEHLLTLSEVAKLIENLSPKVVIPMHYYNPGLTSPCSTLKPIDHWLSQQSGIQKVPAAGVNVLSDRLPPTREVWVFERAEATAKKSGSLLIYLPCVFRATGPWVIILCFLFGILIVFRLWKQFRKRFISVRNTHHKL